MITRESVGFAFPVQPLAEVAEFLDNRRKPVKESERKPGPFPYYGANGQQGTIDDYIFDEPLILLAEDGGFFDQPDRGIAYRISGKTWVNNHAHVIRPRKGVDLAYLCRVLENYDVTPYISGSTRAKLTKGQAEKIEIPLPSLEKQKRIAAILDQADELRRKRQRALDRLNQLGQAIYIEMFSETDRHGWTEKNLSELCDIQVGFAFKSPDYTEDADAVRLCRGANVLPGRIDWSDTARLPEDIAKRHIEFALREGDIAIAMDRPWISDGFKVARMEASDLPALLVQRVARLRATAPRDSEFLYYLVNSAEFQQACRTTETTVPHISPKDIRGYNFFCPPKEQRSKFTQRISLIRDMAKQAETLANHSNKLFSSLQHRAFRGELAAFSLREAAA